MDNNLIPKGLSLKFNLNLKTEKENLKELCMQHLAKASLNLVKENHLSTKNEVTILQRKLDLVRAEVYEELEKETANLLIKKTKSKISKLKRKLDFIESKKLSKAITVKPEDTDLRNSSVSKKRNRRFDKSLRTRRHKNKQNHSIHVIDEDNENVDTNIKLDPINLSNVPITEEQKQLLRKGPKFCPMPKDVNWMKLMDDWKRFERRIRLTAYHHKRNITTPQAQDTSQEEEDQDSRADEEDLYPKVPSDNGRKWNPPKSNIPEIEMFLSSVKRQVFQPGNLKVAKDNLSKKERLAIK